jgi:DNA-binding protein H-NS
MFTRAKPQPALPQSPEALAKETLQPSIHELSFAELKAFHTHVGEILAQKETQARLDFKRDFIDRMSVLGLSIEDLKPAKVNKKKREVTIKYRDPDNPDNVWTGIGKPKRWLQEKLDAGHALEQYEVGTNARAAS